MSDLSTLELSLIGALVIVLTLGLCLFVAWRVVGKQGRALSRRVSRLPLRQQVRLAGLLFGDPRLPVLTRGGIVLLVLYLALPIDLIPDFIPLLGQVDDIVGLTLGGALLLKTVPTAVIEEHLLRIEAELASLPSITSLECLYGWRLLVVVGQSGATKRVWVVEASAWKGRTARGCLPWLRPPARNDKARSAVSTKKPGSSDS